MDVGHHPGHLTLARSPLRQDHPQAAVGAQLPDRRLLLGVFAFACLVFALTGLEMKMRQYEVGEKFCAAVVRESDLATLNRVWESAESMPTMDELKNPERWLARMRSSHH